MKQILVSVSETGEVTINAIDFKGAACEQATAALEKALGQTKSKIRKPEYNQDNANKARAGQG